MTKKAKVGSSGVPIDESNSDRFIRVVTPRIGKAVKAIGVIGFCAGSTYEYSESQVDQIIHELESSLISLAQTFAGEKGGGNSFKFK